MANEQLENSRPFLRASKASSWMGVDPILSWLHNRI